MKLFSLSLTRPSLILLVSFLIILFDNVALMRALLGSYPLTPGNIAFLVSLMLLLVSLLALLLNLVSTQYTTKPVLMTVLLIAAVIAYFMNTYNIMIDETMIQNMLETNPAEASDLLTTRLLAYILFLGVLPASLVYSINIVQRDFYKELKSSLLSLLAYSACIVLLVAAFSAHYATFFREHKHLRLYINPLAGLYAAGHYALLDNNPAAIALEPIGLDAKIPETDTDRELIILVIGETARADHFSLNGYEKETNPLLKQENIINFSNVYSCGTTTAVSVPCMFSRLSRHDYSDSIAKSTENILDVLKRAGVNILWRDNNSDSKSVALRATFEDYKSPATNTICDPECRDEGMLVGLEEYIDSHPTGDILIILHAMGSHGPAYYKRYPEAFEKFVPVCRTNLLEDCTTEEIANTYDNTILYTDYFLSRVIHFLKQHDDTFEAAMLYMSDHGESLGESGMYLHGMPYFIAPGAQTRVPAIAWFSDSFEIDTRALREKADHEFSHDHLFHTLLGSMEVETSVYDKHHDILAGEWNP
jgi:lipid A ethanolaminephosphotransferase